MAHDDFSFFAPLRFYKSGDGAHSRRIAGVISTETPDRQGDTILQRGLEFNEFLQHGWFNDNHSPRAQDVVGFPEAVQYFEKGDTLPDGTQAKTALHWAEGHLLPDYEPAEKLWNLGLSLQKAGGKRALGFSVEGKIVRRTGPGNKIIAKANVRNVAVTHCPVNADTRLYALAKSLNAAETSTGDDSWDLVRSLMDQFGKPTSAGDTHYEWLCGGAHIRVDLDKALSMGSGPVTKPEGARTGEGAGRILAVQSLETDLRRQEEEKKLDKGCGSDKMSKSEAIAEFESRLGISRAAAENLVARLVPKPENT